MPDVLVAVLNWNGERNTIECLESLARSDYAHQEVVVLDNGSRPGSVEAIRAAFPGAEIVRNGANLGYAGGNNAGLRLALERGADYCLVLNNDVAVAPDMVRLLVAAAERDAGLALLGPRVYRHDAPDKLFYAGWEIDWRRWLFHRLPETPAAGPGGLADVAFVQGCALMVRVDWLGRLAHAKVGQASRPSTGTPGHRDRPRGEAGQTSSRLSPPTVGRSDGGTGGTPVLLSGLDDLSPDAGGFDERFYLYCEDADLAARVQRAGGRTVEVAAARAWHKGYGSSGRESPLKVYYGWRNRWLFIAKHASAGGVPWRRRVMLRAQLLFGDGGGTAWRCLKGWLRGEREAGRRLRALGRAIADAWLGRYGPGPGWL